jgi:hypothetical protein
VPNWNIAGSDRDFASGVSKMRVAVYGLSIMVAVTCLNAAVPTGPNVGESAPDFPLQDQNGAAQTLRSILGSKGALLVFYRSADW